MSKFLQRLGGLGGSAGAGIIRPTRLYEYNCLCFGIVEEHMAMREESGTQDAAEDAALGRRRYTFAEAMR